MDKEQIAKLAHQMENKEDLLKLLNLIKRDEMARMGCEERFYPFTIRHLNYYCNPKNSFHRFRHFDIKKKSGGVRRITTPKNRSFMLIQQCLNIIFKAVYTPSEYAMGFTEGRSVVTNAEKHKGQTYILNIDLKDFFPSIEQARVWKRLQVKPFNFPTPIANLLAGLCSMKEVRKLEDGTKKIFYVLPQGAPTSPIITNMICDRLDHRLAGLARRFSLHYTRYADDITFSSMHNVYQCNGEFWKELLRIITEQGFRINDKKTRLQKFGAHQEVTGIVVSDKLNVSQEYVRDIRNILYIWDRYGYNVAFCKFFQKYKEEKGHVKKGKPDLIRVLDGKLMYLKMVKGEDDAVYKRLYCKFNMLVDNAKSAEKVTAQHITYIETLPIIEFEKKNNTNVVIIKTGSSKLQGNCCRSAYFIINGEKIRVSVNKGVKPEDETNKELLAISLCRDAKDSFFWLIHKIDKVVGKLKVVDVDKLNEELDLLLNMNYG